MLEKGVLNPWRQRVLGCTWLRLTQSVLCRLWWKALKWRRLSQSCRKSIFLLRLLATRRWSLRNTCQKWRTTRLWGTLDISTMKSTSLGWDHGRESSTGTLNRKWINIYTKMDIQSSCWLKGDFWIWDAPPAILPLWWATPLPTRHWPKLNCGSTRTTGPTADQCINYQDTWTRRWHSST